MSRAESAGPSHTRLGLEAEPHLRSPGRLTPAHPEQGLLQGSPLGVAVGGRPDEGAPSPLPQSGASPVTLEPPGMLLKCSLTCSGAQSCGSPAALMRGCPPRGGPQPRSLQNRLRYCKPGPHDLPLFGGGWGTRGIKQKHLWPDNLLTSSFSRSEYAHLPTHTPAAGGKTLWCCLGAEILILL